MFKSNEAQHNQQAVQTHLEETKITPKKEVVEKNETLKVVIPKKEPNLVLSPSLNFMSNLKHSSTFNEVSYQSVIHKDQKKESIKQEIPKKEKILKPAKKEPDPVIIEEIKLQKSNPIKIQRQITQDDLSHVLKRFSKNNNPALSLFIAKKYYDIEDYHQSYNYALITNRINDNIDASWIIFAKSLVKLGKKDEAIQTLQRYIAHSKSSQAKTLLEEIQRGKFR
ncbi:MAG: CDC27 family protein [Sulfurimonas sp.]|uniref:CDC27 family protein n=1 Tax=Sulfurimonas sp. TaxID=2022749 RepID=UPI0025F26846|nr:CDC27 family protein [Sulfurimonas sp.]MCK9491034.1 CDC27 family protein [Sulfurimonas sp.]